MKMQTKQYARLWVRRLLIGLAVVYFLLLVLVNIDPHPACPVEEHVFKGQKFDIEFCALGGGTYDEKMRLRVYEKSGELLAWRIATFAKEGSLNYVAIEDDKIRYSDDTSNLRSTSIPEDCVLSMPPTWVDWIEARLPGGIPGVNHCGVASDEISEKARHSWRIRQKAERIKEEAAVHEQNTHEKAAMPIPPSVPAPAASE